LAVPPKAQAMACVHGLRVEASHLVSVGAMNPLRRRGKDGDPLRHLILGDHLEAVSGYIFTHTWRACSKPFIWNARLSEYLDTYLLTPSPRVRDLFFYALGDGSIT
jgi:hypothetical protein